MAAYVLSTQRQVFAVNDEKSQFSVIGRIPVLRFNVLLKKNSARTAKIRVSRGHNVNRSYRLIFNRGQHVSQAVSELAGRVHDGSGRCAKSTTGNGAESGCGEGMAHVVIDGRQTVTVPANPALAWNLGGNIVLARSVLDRYKQGSK